LSTTDLLELSWIIPALPAAGAVILLLFGKRIGEPKSGWLATIVMTLAFLASAATLGALYSLDEDKRQVVGDGFTWMEAGGLKVDFRFLVDPLSVTMILFITGVGALIHLYAIGYMHGDPRFSRFFAYMNLFAASMLVLVLGSNYLVTFMGWEGVGLCSYLLISFWFERNSAAVAGKKAFITNRVGDVGFMIAMFLIFSKFGSLDYFGDRGVLHEAGLLPNVTATAIALLLFVGAIGKSAQLPLHFWLPDAMEGPTPVSALIHAATMVTAGVFLMVRSAAFLEVSADAGMIVAWVGAATALFAATVAVRQNDIKRVLAYSTISQLGYMFLGVGIGAYEAAIFLMIAHAFFKALLFLGSGSVIHGMHGEQNMRLMGGLKKWMPVTAGTFIVGWLAIAGVFPFAGFWSKDEILAKAWFNDSYALWAVGTFTALLTAFYMTRQVWLVFYGPERRRDAGIHEPHESPPTMTAPLFALAFLSIVGGIMNLPFGKQNLEVLTEWLAPVTEAARRAPELGGLEAGHAIHPTSFVAGLILSLIALTVAIVGILVGRAVYKKGLTDEGNDPTEVRIGGFAKVLANAYYIDAALAWVVGRPATIFARFLSDGVDRRGIDGAVNGVGVLFQHAGGGLRRLQTGLVRNYALGIVIGTVALLAYVLVRTT